MAERTPPTAAIKQAWIEAHPFRATTTVEGREAEFDRWLAEVRREAAALTPPSLPSVEALADALAAEGIDPEPGELDLTPLAERLLALLPGRAEAEVKAEAWDEVADYHDRTNAPDIAESTRRDNPYRKKEATDE